MIRRTRVAIVAGAAAVLLGGTLAFGVSAWAARQQALAGPSDAQIAAAGSWAGEERLVFRNTAPGDGYGHVASVPLGDPAGPRTVSADVCDRVDATGELLACLRTVRGIVPQYTATVTSADGAVDASWPLPGVPSRTRFSPDGSLVATTSFVTGHSYASVGFSTSTVIARTDGQGTGADLGNLEEWTLLRGGTTVAPADRNYWGVTFADDDTFYATVGMNTAGTTALVRGDIRSRTLTTLADNVECPSLSPDGSRVAFKRVTGGTLPAVHWTPAIYDIATGKIDVLPEERSIDDQIEWLDDDTLLYGMPRPDAPGDSDVWRLEVDGGAAPEIFIEHAWSPAVVADGTAG